MGGALGAAAGGVVGGVGGAFLGGGAGAATGGLLAGEDELQDAKDTITAISRGDVEGLIAKAAGQQKGFIDQAMDTIYDFIKLCLVGIVLWNFVPLAYTWIVHRKHKNGTTEKA
tara:strand:+ start:125 stop:466 length:342 start_codon:yes stop_codon:yes gene_type:complete